MDAAKEAAEQPDAEGDTKEKVSEAESELQDWDEDEGVEFVSLKTLLEELCGYGGDHQWKGDWYPCGLIRDSYFVEAMQELLSDIGELPQEIPHYIVIDWEATANNLLVDYSSVEFGDVTYWYR